MTSRESMRGNARAIGSLVKGKWRITRVLRAGSAAGLYVATARTGSPVSLKIVHAHLAQDERIKKRLTEEAELAGLVNHSGVLRALDEDVTEEGAPLLLLEPLEGETLDARCRRKGGSLPIEEVLDIADLLLDILRAAHEAGVLHFEISPANVFLTNTGLLKVLDLGALDARPRTLLERSQHSARWPVAFTAPELLLDESSDARSDFWAVGALLYRLVTGGMARSPDAPPESVASVPVRALKGSPLDLPRAFVSIVDRALEFDRADRWPDVDSLQQALRWARRSLEGGFGRGEPSPLAEQARLLRQKSARPLAEEGASGPPSVTQMNRVNDSAAPGTSPAETPQAVAPGVEQTLVGHAAGKDSPPPDAPRVALRRVSEPTLQSASIAPDSRRRETPLRPESAVTLDVRSPDIPRPPRVPGADLTSESAPEARDSARMPAEDEPDTLIRAAPRGDATVVDLAPRAPSPTPPRAARQERHEPPPPTVRLPGRSKARVPAKPLVIAGVLGVLAGAAFFIFLPRQGSRKATIDAAFATPSSQLALTVADEAGAAPVNAANAADAGGPLAVGGDANASEAAVVGEKTDAGSGAEAVAQGDAAVVDEAAAELEARLAAERRRRRERERERALQQAAEEAGTSAAEPSEAGPSPAVAVREVDAEAPAPRAAASESPRKPSPAESTDASAPRRAAPAEEDGGT